MTMRGGAKRFIGAGATPSMGLSQFRGGRQHKYEEESESEEEEMEGGRISGLLGNIARARPVSSAIIPFRSPTASTALVPLSSTGRTLSRPSLPASYYQNLFRAPAARVAPTAARVAPAAAPATASLAARLRSGLTASNIARAASLGIPVAMLASYLADQGGAAAGGDSGFYDDYAGDEFGPSGPSGPSDGMPMAPEFPVGLPSGLPSSIPSDLSSDEIAWYLRSGNLPARYTSRGRRGRGVLHITHGGAKKQSTATILKAIMKEYGVSKADAKIVLDEEGADVLQKYNIASPAPRAKAARKSDGRSSRNDIVKRIMRERGVSLPQASKIVKDEGLYSK